MLFDPERSMVGISLPLGFFLTKDDADCFEDLLESFAIRLVSAATLSAASISRRSSPLIHIRSQEVGSQ